MGQSFALCDNCGRPAHEHEGLDWTKPGGGFFGESEIVPWHKAARRIPLLNLYACTCGTEGRPAHASGCLLAPPVPSEVTWLREIEGAMTPGPLAAGKDHHQREIMHLPLGSVRTQPLFRANWGEPGDVFGMVTLRNLSPSMLAVIEAAERTWREMDTLEQGEQHARALSAALDIFRAAVREEQER